MHVMSTLLPIGRVVRLPPSGRKVLKKAFAGCKWVKEVVIPTGYTEIEACAFSECENLRKVTLPKSLKKIGKCAFKKCEHLCEINLQHVEHFGYGAFFHCKSLKTIDLRNAVTIEHGTFCGCSKASLATNDCRKVKTIGIFAFSHALEDACFRFRDLEKIGPAAFLRSGVTAVDCRDCSKLKMLGNAAFSSSRLHSFRFPTENKLWRVPEGCFQECKLEEVILPEGIVSIELAAFNACTSLRRVTFCDSLTEIGTLAFADCVNLRTPYDVSRWKVCLAACCRAFSGCLPPLNVFEQPETFMNGSLPDYDCSICMEWN